MADETYSVVLNIDASGAITQIKGLEQTFVSLGNKGPAAVTKLATGLNTLTSVTQGAASNYTRTINEMMRATNGLTQAQTNLTRAVTPFYGQFQSASATVEKAVRNFQILNQTLNTQQGAWAGITNALRANVPYAQKAYTMMGQM